MGDGHTTIETSTPEPERMRPARRIGLIATFLVAFAAGSGGAAIVAHKLVAISYDEMNLNFNAQMPREIFWTRYETARLNLALAQIRHGEIEDFYLNACAELDGNLTVLFPAADAKETETRLYQNTVEHLEWLYTNGHCPDGASAWFER